MVGVLSLEPLGLESSLLKGLSHYWHAFLGIRG